jgi:putative nucleotidyltransferase with HDIG domain
MKRCILFVGEDQILGREFQAQLSSAGGDWTAEFTRAGSEALALIERSDFDAVVADIELPDMSGVELLDEILMSQPNVLRIVLSDLADAQSTLKCVGRAHHHLLKPCDVPTLLHALRQALELEAWSPGPAVQGLIARMRWVPSPPSIYFEVANEMQSPNASVDRISELIARDPAITAKLLQLANSAVFGLQLQVIQPAEAIAYLGLNTTKALVLLAHTFSSFEQLEHDGFSAESLWRHSVATGQFARRLALMEGSGVEPAEQAFTAGLLHDVGKLLFAANLPKPFGQALALAREQRWSLWEAERRVLGASHAEVGARLLGIWGLPTPVVEAVALHHYPARRANQPFSPLTAVHVANVFDHEVRPEPSSIASSGMDLGYLKELGLDQRVEDWRCQCLASTAEVAV